MIFAASGNSQNLVTNASDIRSVKRFSVIAPPLMLAVIATGLLVADRMVSTNYAALFATKYGWFLNAKLMLLAVVLAIAARAHFVWLPSLDRDSKSAQAGMHGLRIGIRVELAVASLLVFVATLLANTIPAKHDVIEYWPYPFRFSVDATWSDWLVQTLVLAGVMFLVVAVGLIVVGRVKQWGRAARIVVPSVLIICALPLILYPLGIQSYPETYRKTPVPFDAISIANGAGLFAANCVPCHGFQAKGNGVLAKTLPKQPVDLLTEPHTAMHTAGDFFHWLTYGRFNGIMPAF
ncbi:MAG: cytochrome C, partial [Nitrospira sp.]|nr:cytochrome C [Nitrospira sp.]